MDLEWCKRSAQLGNKVWDNLQLAWKTPFLVTCWMFRPSSQPNYRIASVLTRTRIGGEGQTVRTEAVIGWMRSLALQVSAWTLSEDGDLVCSCDQTELLYHSVPFTCKVGFHSSVIVCSWYPSLGKYIAYTEINDLSVAWAIHKLTIDDDVLRTPSVIFLHVTVFRQHCLCVCQELSCKTLHTFAD